MDVALPNSVNYFTPYSSLPEEARNISVYQPPINGSVFNSSEQIIFDFLNRGFVDPKSIYIRYKMKITSTVVGTFNIIGTPAFTPFNRLETSVNSVNVESINQYNQVGHLLCNTTMDIGAKYGMQSALGIGNYAITGAGVPDPSASPAMSSMDGATIVQTSPAGVIELSLAVPLLGSVLYNCEKHIPAFLLGNIRLALTLDAQANVMTTANGTATLSYSNFELCYNILDLGSAIENQIRNSNPVFNIKSQGFSNSSTNIPTGVAGSLSLVFNQRYNSIKSAFVLFNNSSSATAVNKWADFLDITNGQGFVQLQIASENYPNIPLSYLNNKASMLQELRKAVGNFSDSNNALSINSVEFSRGADPTTTIQEPSKVVIGVQLQKLDKSNNVLLSGISSQNSAISVNVNTGSYTTTKSYTANLVLNYDVLLQVNVATKQMLAVQ